jgi:hypothetical protein
VFDAEGGLESYDEMPCDAVAWSADCQGVANCGNCRLTIRYEAGEWFAFGSCSFSTTSTRLSAECPANGTSESIPIGSGPICSPGSDTGGSDGNNSDEPECKQGSTHYCDGHLLKRCGSGILEKDCSHCKYIGAGTGSSYDTSCKAWEAAFAPGEQAEYDGPGCYYGYDPECGPY